MAKRTPSTKPKRDKDFLRKPKYEGGSQAFRKFIGENVQYPAEALEKRIQGDVHVKFDVDEDGRVLNPKIMRAIGGGCDEEALRVVKLLKYIPARNRGTHVTTHHDVVIHFRLPMESVQPHQQTVVSMQPQAMMMNYVFVPQSPEPQVTHTAQEQTNASSNVVFQWTIERP